MPSRVAPPDVNVLIALAWPNHVHHAAAQRWFARRGRTGWATTPVTESGFVRISSNRVALPTATTPMVARELLEQMTGKAGHRFWADDVELVTGRDGSLAQPPGSHREVTDAHLLELAHQRAGCLVTFDKGIQRLLGRVPAAVLHVLD